MRAAALLQARLERVQREADERVQEVTASSRRRVRELREQLRDREHEVSLAELRLQTLRQQLEVSEHARTTLSRDRQGDMTQMLLLYQHTRQQQNEIQSLQAALQEQKRSGGPDTQQLLDSVRGQLANERRSYQQYLAALRRQNERLEEENKELRTENATLKEEADEQKGRWASRLKEVVREREEARQAMQQTSFAQRAAAAVDASSSSSDDDAGNHHHHNNVVTSSPSPRKRQRRKQLCQRLRRCLTAATDDQVVVSNMQSVMIDIARHRVMYAESCESLRSYSACREAECFAGASMFLDTPAVRAAVRRHVDGDQQHLPVPIQVLREDLMHQQVEVELEAAQEADSGHANTERAEVQLVLDALTDILFVSSKPALLGGRLSPADFIQTKLSVIEQSLARLKALHADVQARLLRFRSHRSPTHLEVRLSGALSCVAELDACRTAEELRTTYARWMERGSSVLVTASHRQPQQQEQPRQAQEAKKQAHAHRPVYTNTTPSHNFDAIDADRSPPPPMDDLHELRSPMPPHLVETPKPRPYVRQRSKSEDLGRTSPPTPKPVPFEVIDANLENEDHESPRSISLNSPVTGGSTPVIARVPSGLITPYSPSSVQIVDGSDDDAAARSPRNIRSSPRRRSPGRRSSERRPRKFFSKKASTNSTNSAQAQAQAPPKRSHGSDGDDSSSSSSSSSSTASSERKRRRPSIVVPMRDPVISPPKPSRVSSVERNVTEQLLGLKRELVNLFQLQPESPVPQEEPISPHIVVAPPGESSLLTEEQRENPDVLLEEPQIMADILRSLIEPYDDYLNQRRDSKSPKTQTDDPPDLTRTLTVPGSGSGAAAKSPPSPKRATTTPASGDDRRLPPPISPSTAKGGRDTSGDPTINNSRFDVFAAETRKLQTSLGALTTLTE